MKAITEVTNKSDIIYAHTLDDHIRLLKTKVAEHIMLLGQFLKEMRDGELYRCLDCESFNDYIARPEIGFKRSSVYNFIRFYELYVEELGIEPHLLSNIGHGRLLTIASVVRDNPDEWLAKAETLSTSDLINEVREARGKKPMVPNVQETSNGLDVVATGYLEFVRRHPCIYHPDRKSVAAHWPVSRGTGHKAPDHWVIPLCVECHDELHHMGDMSWLRAYRHKIAEYFYDSVILKLFNAVRGGQNVKEDTVPKLGVDLVTPSRQGAVRAMPKDDNLAPLATEPNMETDNGN